MFQTKKQLKKRISELENELYDYEDYQHVLTGTTYSYNALRDLILEILEKTDNFDKTIYLEKVKQIDKIAHHITIVKDDWIGPMYRI